MTVMQLDSESLPEHNPSTSFAGYAGGQTPEPEGKRIVIVRLAPYGRTPTACDLERG